MNIFKCEYGDFEIQFIYLYAGWCDLSNIVMNDENIFSYERNGEETEMIVRMIEVFIG